MKRLVIVVFVFSVFALGSGCVTRRSPDFAGYQLQMQVGKEQKSIAYSLRRSGSASVDKEFNPNSTAPAMAGCWVGPQPEATVLQQFNSVFQPTATAITPTVDQMGGNCDIMLELHQQNAWNPLAVFPAMLGGFSLGLVPCWGDDVFHLNVKATNKTGLRREYTISRAVTTTTWLPCIFVMPVSESPVTARENVTLENWKELRGRMEADGFFDAGPSNQAATSVAECTTKNAAKEDGCDAAKKFIELKRLKDQGVLTQEEYLKAVERIK